MAKLLPVLTFHAIDERESAISMSPRTFAHGMETLYKHGYRTTDLRSALDCVKRGGVFPDRHFVITFDDGYESVYAEAFPVLQRFESCATVFLATGQTNTSGRLAPFEGRSMLSWNEIRAMQEGGITFGAHTCTHPDLSRLPHDDIIAEVTESKKIIEDALGKQVDCFAYPFGRFDSRCRDIVRQHFVCACSDRLGFVSGRSDPFALKRIDAYYLRSNGLFDLTVSSLFPWYIRGVNVPRSIRRLLQAS